MTKLKKCPKCKTYTLEDICKNCISKTIFVNYKFIQIRDAPPRSAPFNRK